MHNRFLVALFGAMIFVSAFLGFAELPPVGSPQSPFQRLYQVLPLSSFDPAPLLALPPLAQAFGLSFLLGLLCCLLALLGWAPRLLALVTALLPLGCLIYAWFGGRAEVERLGITLPSGPFSEVFGQIGYMAGWGFWLWLSGAALLLMTALLDSGAED